MAKTRGQELTNVRLARHDAYVNHFHDMSSGMPKSSFHSIVSKLTALGWGNELDMHGNMLYHKLVHQPVPLTERSSYFFPLFFSLSLSHCLRLVQYGTISSQP